MRFSHALQRQPSKLANTFQPTVEMLEGRIVPSAYRQILPHPIPVAGTVTHFQVVAPATAQAGQTFNAVIEAEDANNHIVSGYRGTVHLSLGTAEAGASFPTTFTFTAADHGMHLIHVTLPAVGNQTIIAKDTTGKIAGAAAVDVTLPPTHILVFESTAVTAGLPTTVTIEILNASNQPVSGYTGTVHLSSTDTNAILPADYTFQASDNGIYQFAVIFNTVGQQTLSATDTVSGLSGSSVAAVISAYSYGYGYYGGYGYGGYVNRGWWY